MSHDPTKWPTPMHAWRYWFDRSNELEKEVFEFEEAYFERYDYSTITIVRMENDPEYRRMVGRQRYAEARAATFGMAVMIRTLEVLTEQGRLE